MRINVFENYPTAHNVVNTVGRPVGVIMMQGVYLPGSISINTVAVAIRRSQSNAARTLSIYFGLYSLNGSSFSLYNSGSQSDTLTVAASTWLTLNMSTTGVDLTQGNWYYAFMSSTAGISRYQFFGNQGANINSGVYGGIFVRGYYSATTNAFPASEATSNFSKEVTATSLTDMRHPYIIISA